MAATRDEPFLTPIVWIGRSLADVREFPRGVREGVGFALYRAQLGEKHASVKPLRGFGGASVLEIVEGDGRGTYRCVYTVRFEEAVYVLHAFQKKSKKGIKTDKHDIEVIGRRLAVAAQRHEEWKREQGRNENEEASESE